MKSLSRLLSLIALLLAGASAHAAAETPAAAPKPEKAETELTRTMDKVNAAYRKLRKQAGDAAQNAGSLALVATIREHIVAAAKLEPFKLTEIPAAGRPKMLEGYRAKMKELLATIGELEAALKAGHNGEAANLVEAMKALQKEGHKEYKSKSID
ncbi:MAG: hypothetical protein HYX71_08510 [Opitutae bacterium]|nr:hypothetical protein [Opitutae bacterium]